MKQRGGQSGGVEAHVGEDMGDLEEMGDVGVAGTAELVAVALCGNVEGTTDEPGIIRRAIGAELSQELLEASISLSFGAVAVEVQGQIGWRRHALVYDGKRRGERAQGQRGGGPSQRKSCPIDA